MTLLNRIRIGGCKGATFHLILFASLSVFNVVVATMFWGRGGVFWDLDGYTRAVDDYAVAVDPYRTDIVIVFIYHPYVLKLFSAIDGVVSIAACLTAWYLAATSYFLTELALLTRRQLAAAAYRSFSIEFILLVFGAASYGGSGVVSFLSGNVSAFIHLTLAAVLINIIRSNARSRINLFLLLVAVFSLIKPYFLAYLLAMFILVPVRCAILCGALVASAVSLVWMSAGYLMPSEYDSFVAALFHQTLGTGDVGYAVFGAISPYMSGRVALLVHVVVTGAVVYALCCHIPKVLNLAQDQASRLLLVLIAVILINPRMKEYDFLIAMICAFFFVFFLCRERAFALLSIGLSASVVAVSILTFVKEGTVIPGTRFSEPWVASHQLQIAGFGLTGLAIWLFVAYRSCREHIGATEHPVRERTDATVPMACVRKGEDRYQL